MFVFVFIQVFLSSNETLNINLRMPFLCTPSPTNLRHQFRFLSCFTLRFKPRCELRQKLLSFLSPTKLASVADSPHAFP